MDPAQSAGGMEVPGMFQGLLAELRTSPEERNMLVLTEDNVQGLGSEAHPDPVGTSGGTVTSLTCRNM